MKNDWLVVSEEKDPCRNVNVEAKLQNIMNQIDEGRGWRFTEEQAETLSKLVDKLVEQVKKGGHSEPKETCTEHKSFIKVPFFSFKMLKNH